MKAMTSIKRVSLVVFALMLSVTMSLGLTVSAFAASSTFVMDSAGALTDSEKQALEAEASSVSNSSGIGVYVAFVNDIGNASSQKEAAKSIYNNQQLGLGQDRSGVLLMVAVKSRDYAIITYGQGVNAFSDGYIDDMKSDVKSKLSDNKWNKAAEVYVKEASTAVTYYAEHGSSYREPANPLISFVIALIAALVVASLVVSGQKGKMKTAVAGSEADDYLDDGSFDLTHSRDDFQGTVVVCIKTHQQKQAERRNNSHSVDSSGFGGSGGKF